ncbi:hypothetical protein LXL04_020183 [Taraxacum kok-saghyz]
MVRVTPTAVPTDAGTSISAIHFGGSAVKPPPSSAVILVLESTVPTTSIVLIDDDVSNAVSIMDCPRVRHNITIGTLPFVFVNQNVNLSFHFNCTGVPDFASEIPCLSSPTNKSCVNRVDSEPQNFNWEEFSCDEEVVTMAFDVFGSESRLGTEFIGALRAGFELSWWKTEDCEKCEQSRGMCGYNKNTTEFMCFCSDGTATLEHCNDIQRFRDCSTKFYTCGEATTYISYPFWGNERPSYCGLQGFRLTCREDNITTVQIMNTTFRVIRIDQNNSKVALVLDDLRGDEPACSLRRTDSISTTTFQYTLFSYVPNGSLILGLYFSCEDDVVRSIPIRKILNCSADEGDRGSFFENTPIPVRNRCERVIGVPVSMAAFDAFNRRETMSLEELLWQGFEMEYRVDGGGICSRCQSTGGTCGSYFNSSGPSCMCPDGFSRLTCFTSASSSMMWRIKVVLGVGSALLSIGLIAIIIYCIRKSSPNNSCVALFKHQTEDDKSVETFVTQYGSLGTKRYTYADIKKMTNSFQVKLGQGGFGTVFKGKLSDGRLVAVKILNSSKASGQEFINEVASIGRTSHVNIVMLLGFCFDHTKKALVYEFMSNGSLEKFIYGQIPQSTSEHICVEKLYEIALAIAQGLDYLHRGCKTRILHLDIKPHNILLDEDFCPKIADFGLAKLYSRKESIVSMLEARGTIGYIAPEVFNRNFGGVSHKSDVYSYGMLILEMVGGRKNVDVGVGSGHTSEIYFPYWIYSRLEKDEFLLDSVTTVEENDSARKMTIVGLWCIQNDPRQRPSISEVIEMLEGSMEALEIPPKPFFSSPPRSPPATFNTSEESSFSSSPSILHSFSREIVRSAAVLTYRWQFGQR